MKTLFYIICLCITAAVAVRQMSKMQSGDEYQKPEVRKRESLYTLSQKVDRMTRINSQLKTVERMITEIESCSPNQHEKPMQMVWTDAQGIRQTYDFWVDGAENSERLLDIAYAERDRLRSALLDADDTFLAERCNANVYENDAYYIRGGEYDEQCQVL